MKKEEQLKQAKSLAVTFLHIPMTETEYSPIAVQHPFFESAFLYDGNLNNPIKMFNALEDTEKYNDYLYTYAKNVIEPCKSISELVCLIRKSYRLAYLLFMRKEKIITKKECGNLLAENWTLIENLSVDTNVEKSTVLSWIKAADKEKLMDEQELKKYQNFPDILTIYRGCRVAKALKGMSWTLSESKARWFAGRFARDGGVTFRAHIHKEDIVCYLASRGEQEVVVDYRKLFDIKQI